MTVNDLESGNRLGSTEAILDRLDQDPGWRLDLVDLVLKFAVRGGDLVFGRSRNEYGLAMSEAFGSIWTVVMIRVNRERLGPNATNEPTDGASRIQARTSLPAHGKPTATWCR